MSSVPRRARVAMRISSAVMQVGLKNTPQAASVSASARSLGSLPGGGVGDLVQRCGQGGEAWSMTALSSPSRSPK